MNTNLTVIAIFIAALALPLSAFAIASEWRSPDRDPVYTSELREVAFHGQDMQVNLTTQNKVIRHSFIQTSQDRQNELFIEFCVYIVIIMIYSIYSLKES